MEDITDLETYVNVRGFLDQRIEAGELVPGSTVALAGDLRPSTDGPQHSILKAVARAGSDAGMRVRNCGRIPTPALAAFALPRGWVSVMVTGSHIPFDRNGIKFMGAQGEVLKEDEPAILAAVERVRSVEYRRPREDSLFDDAGRFAAPAPALPPASDDAYQAYLHRYVGAFGSEALVGCNVAVYQHSAVGRDLLVEILSALGANVQAVGRSDTFVAIDTEAVAAGQLDVAQALADEARHSLGRLDALVSTDGDSDRPLVFGLDDRGTVQQVPGDLLGLLTAQALGADAAAVPVSSTDVIERVLDGVHVVRTRIGSPYVISAMNSLSGERRVGWEANGGFLLGSEIATDTGTLAPLPTRDAVLPIVMLVRLAKERGVSVLGLVSELPPRFSASGLLDEVERQRSAAVLERLGSEDDELWARHLGRFGDVEAVDRTDGLRIRFASADVVHLRPSGNAPQLRVYALADSKTRAQALLREMLGRDGEGGIVRELLADVDEARFVQRVLRNIEVGRSLWSRADRPALIGTVSGTAAARTLWQRHLARATDTFGGCPRVSLHEDLPVGQAFGLLLMWQRIRPRLGPDDGALVTFVFGDGTRASPLTEAEAGQKPAIASFVRAPSEPGQFLPTALVAMQQFAPVERFLRASGFRGVVVKWGDEIQIPSLDLTGSDPRFADADVVRFVSMQVMTEADAASKDWVGLDADGRVIAFIPRRPLAAMRRLADRGLVQRRGEALIGGVNLGSIAVSRVLLDALLDEFTDDIADASADRKARPDLDPQLFTALTIAAYEDVEQRAEQWHHAQADSPAVARLAQRTPDLFERLIRVVERFGREHGRRPKLVALDFGTQYWADIGEHPRMRAVFMSLREEGARGQIARALAGIPEPADAQGNRLVGDCQLGADVSVTNSVLVDVSIERGTIDGSVLLGTHSRDVTSDRAFDVLSVAPTLELRPNAGAYKVVSSVPVVVEEGHRQTTVFAQGTSHQLRVDERADLRDKEHVYESDALGNPVSFGALHRKVLAEDAERLEELRAEARGEVAAAIRTPEDPT